MHQIDAKRKNYFNKVELIGIGKCADPPVCQKKIRRGTRNAFLSRWETNLEIEMASPFRYEPFPAPAPRRSIERRTILHLYKWLNSSS